MVVSLEREAWGVTETDAQSAGSEMPPHELGNVLKQVVALRAQLAQEAAQGAST